MRDGKIKLIDTNIPVWNLLFYKSYLIEDDRYNVRVVQNKFIKEMILLVNGK